nr:MAG TPA: hypothetical protein [Caudoviricetes sp.]
MTEQKIQKRMEELRAEYEQLMEEINKANNALQQMTMRKVQIEGAFNELNSFLEDAKTEDTQELKVVEE